ncbi:MAG: hypothetical protein J5590_05985 [Clostridia bacterium]|nr:hypothetical protein [Clostridia bacterium]
MRLQSLVNKKRYIAIFLFSLFVILLTLFRGDNVYLSDNGDFERVMRLSSLYKSGSGEILINLNGQSLFSSLLKILFGFKGFLTYPSSQVILVRLGVAVNVLSNVIFHKAPETFNIYILGFLFGVLYALALSFTLGQIGFKSKLLSVLFCFFSVVLFCDIAYISYFNSLYGEGIQQILFVFLLGFILMLFNKGFKKSHACIFFVILILYGTVKPFNMPAAVIYGIIYAVTVFVKYPVRKNRIITAAAFALSVVLLLLSVAVIPGWIKKETNYNSVFFGILRNCSDAEAKEYLKSMELDDSLFVLKDTHSYVSDAGEIRQLYDLSEVDNISYTKLLSFYIFHPLKTLKTVKRILKFCGMLQNQFFLNCDYMRDYFRMNIWSRIREKSGFDLAFINALVIIAFFVVITRLLCSYYNKKRHAVLVSGLLLITVLYAFFSPYVANGEADLSKHMFLYMGYIDVMLLWLLYTAFSKKGLLKKVSVLALLLVLIFYIKGNIYSSPETVSFGRYKGRDLNWTVIDETEDYKTLILSTSVCTQAYSENADNCYEDSWIRNWLNGDFLSEFTEDERMCLSEIRHKVLYSKSQKENAAEGNRDFYCCLYPELAYEGTAEAYGSYVTDTVVLPSVSHIKTMAALNYKIADSGKYWLETCYFNNKEKVRYVNTDGFIYFENADKELGIRPVIHLKK